MTAMPGSSRASPPGRRYQIPRFVSGDRLREILRDRLGCAPTGERELYFSYWVAPDGRRFRLVDPIVDPSGSYTMNAQGRWERVYSIHYARRLIAYLARHVGLQPAADAPLGASGTIEVPMLLPYPRIDLSV